VFSAVFDGHGEEGHLVSEFLLDFFSIYLEKKRKNKKMPFGTTKESVQKKLQHLVNKVQKYIEGNIDKFKSNGSTLNGVYLTTEEVFSLNIGDSRSIAYCTDLIPQ
jgi:serine/threonine protein phosphatase PrpC